MFRATDLRQNIVVVGVNKLRAAGVVVYNASSSCAPRVASASGTDRVDVLQHKFIYEVNTHWFCHSFGHPHFMGLVGLFWVEQCQTTSRVWAQNKATLILSYSRF